MLAHLARQTHLLLSAAAWGGWFAVGIGASKYLASRVDMDAPAMVAMSLMLILVVGLPAAVGALVLYWSIAEEAEFVRRGYRIRQLPPRQYLRWPRGPMSWTYEELTDDGVRSWPFVRWITEPGYPSSSEVILPNDDSWDAQVPPWAQGRRTEIAERILHVAGRCVTRIRAAQQGVAAEDASRRG